MIKKDTIRKTAVTYWSCEDECFVMESPLFDRVAGTGETTDEAYRVFVELLDVAYDELEKENVVGYKRGRPAKSGVNLHCQVRPDTRESISEITERHGISQGEAIDIAIFHYLKLNHRAEQKNAAKKITGAFKAGLAEKVKTKPQVKSASKRATAS